MARAGRLRERDAGAEKEAPPENILKMYTW